MFQFLTRLFRRRKPVITIGKGYDNARALHKVLCETKQEALRAKQNNYRKSVRRILDETKN